MNRVYLLFLFFVLPGSLLHGREFTVLVYNVENLFDVDGDALYADYEQPPEGQYGPGLLLKKLEGIKAVLATFNNGSGPEIILFQELELDRTPEGTPDAATFLKSTQGKCLREILENDSTALNLPSDLLLLKFLHDNGISGYHIAQADPARMLAHPAHKNVIFSRFPILSVSQRPMLNARDLLIAELDIEGNKLILMNNHWKSGASNPDLEPVRVENAKVVKDALDSILDADPLADVIIAGDLNSYYNHRVVFPDIGTTAVNDVLGANGREDRMEVEGSRNLYNLWFELKPSERGSEVYRGAWGTLMQMILTPGLYDQSGIQYVDNSFRRLAISGFNIDRRWHRPRRWIPVGGGSGFSDHLPIYARFRTVKPGSEKQWMPLTNPSSEPLGKFRPIVDFSDIGDAPVKDLSFLSGCDEAQRATLVGEVFAVKTSLYGEHPPTVKTGNLELEIYSPIRDIREMMSAKRVGQKVHFYGELGVHRGQLQLVIQDRQWLLCP